MNPDVRFDHQAGCRDFSHMGEDCPFYANGQCHFLGWDYPEPVPADEVCDKNGLPIPLDDVLKFDLMSVEQWEALRPLRKSAAFKRWCAAMSHYGLPKKARLAVEFGIFQSRALLSRREMRKRFKPNNIGVQPGEAPSFRTRVLTWLLNRKEENPSSGAERVALKVVRAEHYKPGAYRELWWPYYYTRNSAFERFWGANYPEFVELLEAAFREHEGKKLLVEWRWEDWAPTEARLIKVLDAAETESG